MRQKKMILSNAGFNSYVQSYFIGKKVKAKWTVAQEEFLITEVDVKINGSEVKARVKGEGTLWFDDGDWEFIQ